MLDDEGGSPWDLVVAKSNFTQDLIVTVTQQAPLMTVQLHKRDVQHSCSGVATNAVRSAFVNVPDPCAVFLSTFSQRL